MLKVIECRPGRPSNETTIDLSQGPATIGRGRDATIQVASGVDPRTVYFRTLSKIQATLYQEGDAIFLKDGGVKPSANGIFFKGRRTYAPIELYQGIEIELFPKAGDYHLLVAWPFDKAIVTEAETLIRERETLQKELMVADGEVERLTWTVSELEKKLNQNVQFSQKLNQRMRLVLEKLKQQQKSNQIQDQRLKLLKRVLVGFAIAAFAATWLMLGGDAETITLLGKLTISILSFLGLITGLKNGELSN